MLNNVEWTNPHAVDLTKGTGVLYFIRVTEGLSGIEYKYVGQTIDGRRRFGEYRNNVSKIFEGMPRRTTRGQEKYRPVHLALAKACQYSWDYEFFPLENANVEDLNTVEQRRRIELGCGLNVRWSWDVKDYARLCMTDIP